MSLRSLKEILKPPSGGDDNMLAVSRPRSHAASPPHHKRMTMVGVLSVERSPRTILRLAGVPQNPFRVTPASRRFTLALPANRLDPHGASIGDNVEEGPCVGPAPAQFTGPRQRARAPPLLNDERERRGALAPGRVLARKHEVIGPGPSLLLDLVIEGHTVPARAPRWQSQLDLDRPRVRVRSATHLERRR